MGPEAVVPPVPELEVDVAELPLAVFAEADLPVLLPLAVEELEDVFPAEEPEPDVPDELDVLDVLDVLEVLDGLPEEVPVSSPVAVELDVFMESAVPNAFAGFDVMCEFAATCLPLSISDTF